MSDGGGEPARGELDLYSGRPNPSWTLSAQERAELERRLRGLEVRTAGAADDGGLGYRGVIVRAPDPGGFELAVHGAEAVVRRGAREVVLADEGRALERWLLETARGRLDDTLLELAGRSLTSP
jgi:hypothetical protein